MKTIYIYGASGHGLVVADIARLNGYEKIVFIDDGKNDHLCFEDIEKNIDIPIALGIGDNFIRAKLFDKVVKNGFNIVTLIHPFSVIASDVNIGIGTVVMANVVINADAKIGNGVILNTSCIIEHENIICDYVHISPNVALAGNVMIDKNTHIGISSTVIQGIKIGSNCIIGAGSVVVKNIKNKVKAFGNPCKIVEDIDE